MKSQSPLDDFVFSAFTSAVGIDAENRRREYAAGFTLVHENMLLHGRFRLKTTLLLGVSSARVHVMSHGHELLCECVTEALRDNYYRELFQGRSDQVAMLFRLLCTKQKK